MSPTTSTTNKTAYMGVADAHGIESFLPSKEKEDKRGFLLLRAATNRQRHAVFFEIELDEKQAASVQKEIDKDDYVAALLVIKAAAAAAGEITLDGGGDVLGSFELIPNPKIDPWG